MNVSPYIEESLKYPAPKVFYTPEDILFDRKLSFQDKALLLKNVDLLEGGLIHITRE